MTKFEKAVSIVQNLPADGPVKPSQDQQLKFYGLYKQGTVGDVNTARPGAFDFKGKYKWDAWKANEGMSEADAQSKYVALLLEVLKANPDPESEKYVKEIEEAA